MSYEEPKTNPPEQRRKSDWALSSGAFHRLLQWIDDGEDSAGQEYLEIRRRLVLYFDRKNSPVPEELADETLNRVARRLEEEGEIDDKSPAHYCYIVARFVYLESLRQQKKQDQLDDDVPLISPNLEPEERMEQRSEHLAKCMQKLTATDRDLIVSYYQGEQRVKIDNRKAMASRLGLSMNALSIRACRIRDKLESCMRGLENER